MFISAKVTDTMQQLEGRFSAPEQTNATGQPDYALNTEILWNLDLYAYKINFTIEQLDLDAYAGDLLLIGYGAIPVPPARSFSWHVVGEMPLCRLATFRYSFITST